MQFKKVLQNTSICSKNVQPPSIKLEEGCVGWEEAYANWLAGKNPTDNQEWKSGVYLHFEPLPEEGYGYSKSNSKSFLYFFIFCFLLLYALAFIISFIFRN